MTSRNEHTGHALKTKGFSKAYDEGFAKVDTSVTLESNPAPVFKVYDCKTCHVKVSASKPVCPGCGGDLCE